MDDVLASTEYARTTAFAIDALLNGGNLKSIDKTPEGPVAQNLASLAIRLQQFRQHSDQLGTWLRDGAAAGLPSIQSTIAELARECRKVSVIVFNEVDRLVKGSSETVDPNVLAEYNAVLAAYSRAFVFFTQILSFSEGDKESKLNHPDYHLLIANAQAGAEKIVSSRGNLLDHNNSNLPAIKAGV